MKAGQLRHRVTLQAPATAQDEAGQMLTTWTDVAPVWADIKYVTGMSAIKAGMDTSSAKAAIRIRHRTGVNAGMRVLYGATVFDVEAVMPNEQYRTIDLVCVVKNAVT
jgi:SPP1 family predicted phage head-tail adaptor